MYDPSIAIGDRIKVWEEVVKNDPRELTGTVISVDELSETIGFELDASLILDPSFTKRYCPLKPIDNWTDYGNWIKID